LIAHGIHEEHIPTSLAIPHHWGDDVLCMHRVFSVMRGSYTSGRMPSSQVMGWG